MKMRTIDIGARFPHAVLCVSISHGWHQISSSEEGLPTSGSSSASSWSVVPARAKSGLALQRTGTPPHNQTSWLLLSEWGNMGQKWHSCQNCNGKNQGWFGAVQGAYRRWQGKEGRGEHRISWAEEVHFQSVFFRAFPTLSATKKMGETSFFPAIKKCLILNLKAIKKCF